MAGYNRSRAVEELLERTASSPPSFTVHLHPESWTLNNGLKFMYNHQIASLLDDIRAHRIPVDFLDLFDAAGVPFYDGCMIVELLDYRPTRFKEPTPDKPERTRAVLHPNSETQWADICALNKKYGNKWTDHDALEVEARILLATSPPLCLAPDPHLTRIANHVLRVSTPTVPASLKRKAAVLDPEEEETDKARRAKIMQFMNPTSNRTHAPTYRILDAIQRSRAAKDIQPPPVLMPGQQTMALVHPVQHPPPPQPVPPMVTQSPADSEDSRQKSKKQKKEPTPSPYERNGTQTPGPSQMTQFIVQNQNQNHHSPSPIAQSPAAKRVPTPAQQQHRFSQSPKVSTPQSHPSQIPQIPLQSKLPQHQQHTQPPPPSSLPTFQLTTPPTHVLHQTSPGNRNAQPKPPTNNIPQQAMPQQQPHPSQQHPGNAPNQTRMQMMYNHQMQQQAQQSIQQQRINAAQQQQAAHNGRLTPQGVVAHARSPMIPQRNSPMAPNKSVGAARSPMPQNPQQQQAPQMSMSHPPHLNFNQYNPASHLRPMVHAASHSPHPQGLSQHLANNNNNNGGGGVANGPIHHTPSPVHQQPSPAQVQVQALSQAQALAQSQNQLHSHPQSLSHPQNHGLPPHLMAQYPHQMYNYPPINFGMQPGGRLPQGYWVSGGRLVNNSNGQPMPGMGMVPNVNAHGQQVGKTVVPGGLQGR